MLNKSSKLLIRIWVNIRNPQKKSSEHIDLKEKSYQIP
jgi:hypothetical protein